MNEIPDKADQIAALKAYLEANCDDQEGDSWIFGHGPKITAFLNNLSREEYDRLQAAIGGWSDDILYHLADPMLDTQDGLIDGGYMYCLIFVQVTKLEFLEYLIQNLAAAVWQIKAPYSPAFLERILKQAIRVNAHFDDAYSATIEQIKRRIEA